MTKKEEFEYPMDEDCKCKCEPVEMPPKMNVYIEQGIPNPMFQVAFHRILDDSNGYVYVVFKMGSVQLDMDNPKNYLDFNRDYVEIYNDETGETTMIKIDEITGFVFEHKIPLSVEDLEARE